MRRPPPDNPELYGHQKDRAMAVTLSVDLDRWRDELSWFVRFPSLAPPGPEPNDRVIYRQSAYQDDRDAAVELRSDSLTSSYSAIWPPQDWLRRLALHLARDCRTTNDHADPRISMYKSNVLNSADPVDLGAQIDLMGAPEPMSIRGCPGRPEHRTARVPLQPALLTVSDSRRKMP